MTSATKTRPTLRRAYCNSCHRDDAHIAVEGTPGMIVASILTLGLFALFWPHQCNTCGSKRPIFILTKPE